MKLSSSDILQIFKDTGALLNGHFKLTSGLHSGTYFQCAQVLQYPWEAEKICSLIAAHYKNTKIDLVASPAIGGIVIGYEVARLLQVRSIFTERKNGNMSLRRGFQIKKGEKILIVEDVTTTGGSVKEVMELMKQNQADIAGVASMVDRSGGKAEFNVPFYCTFEMEVTNYAPEDCPLCKKGIPINKPGSRK
jgi:orotate phosphoribosyltransferase